MKSREEKGKDPLPIPATWDHKANGDEAHGAFEISEDGAVQVTAVKDFDFQTIYATDEGPEDGPRRWNLREVIDLGFDVGPCPNIASAVATKFAAIGVLAGKWSQSDAARFIGCGRANVGRAIAEIIADLKQDIRSIHTRRPDQKETVSKAVSKSWASGRRARTWKQKPKERPPELLLAQAGDKDSSPSRSPGQNNEANVNCEGVAA